MTHRITPVLLAALLFVGFDPGGFEKGNRLFRAGRYGDAVAAYRAALDAGDTRAELRYNLGTALLHVGQVEEARRHLRQALDSVDPELRSRALFNLGYSYLADTTAAGAGSPAQRLDDAAEAFRDALRARSGDPDAKWNLELALQELNRQPPPPPAGSGRDRRQQDASQAEPESGDSGSDDEQRESEPRPAEPPSASGSPMSRAQAERILAAAEQDERDLFREKLQRGRRDSPVTKDW